ncbi:hypothetical protein PF005_g7623 [Phytophthora fragariae]|uniref:Uncharacterized protein n=1 Tax=Phytophthora fragariae TaxID=53985 RepID=A0A6A4E473_9STRA|nr:hypothetical protein PF003_g38333 [Phytophthora fragariae]KAE8941804.1 hypothetical protein PF009_g8409 [Phytophthora fragariae]KAE8974869.1 hypothetical protein PF011_g24695 [Phytophthora fragariae]KAE9073384.1 hypothetical protein PF007_g25823 [Phytophthora fragariae]KAE9092542.1 hypothetical protein PF006_g24665 [Phytophthora fragariae]
MPIGYLALIADVTCLYPSVVDAACNAEISSITDCTFSFSDLNLSTVFNRICTMQYLRCTFNPSRSSNA